MYKLCVFAGTSEGRLLIEGLTGRGLQITICVATAYGEVVLGRYPDVEIRAGRLPVEEITAMLKREGFSVVVDATHPYADHITESIRSACAACGVDYVRLLRGSTAREGDGVFVPDVESCVRYLQQTRGNVLLTTGSKNLSQFCEDPALRGRLYARVLPLASSLQLCQESGLESSHILAMQGPFSEEMNLAMLRAVDARYLVTKDTGKAGGYADKIRAARCAGVQPVIIGRPQQQPGDSLEQVLAQLEKRFALPMEKQVVLVGIGMGNAGTRTLAMEQALQQADCLIGAKRMLESVDTGGKRVYTAIAAGEIAALIRQTGDCRKFAVLLSGDTGFYSGAQSLLRELPEEIHVEVLPGVGSLSYFCARLQRPWETVRAVSLHGRNCDLVREVRRNDAVFTLLGGKDGAQQALRRLQKAGFGRLRAHVGQHLGYPNEKITSGCIDELEKNDYDSLSVLLIENPYAGQAIMTHGLPDEAFDRDTVPMTKAEVRSVSLSKLQLTRDAVVYDIGAGSGSVSVECALQVPGGMVYAIEKKENAVNLILQNREKFQVSNLEVVQGEAPEALQALPAPTHAFIGGSSGNLREIVALLLKKNPTVRIVANAITLETMAELTALLPEFSQVDVAEVAVSKGRSLGRYHLMTAQNPVYIVTLQNEKA